MSGFFEDQPGDPPSAIRDDLPPVDSVFEPGALREARERWYDVPGVLALVIVLGGVGALCLAATIGGWW